MLSCVDRLKPALSGRGKLGMSSAMGFCAFFCYVGVQNILTSVLPSTLALRALGALYIAGMIASMLLSGGLLHFLGPQWTVFIAVATYRLPPIPLPRFPR